MALWVVSILHGYYLSLKVRSSEGRQLEWMEAYWRSVLLVMILTLTLIVIMIIFTFWIP